MKILVLLHNIWIQIILDPDLYPSQLFGSGSCEKIQNRSQNTGGGGKNIVADLKQYSSDPDPTGTWRVITDPDPDPTWRFNTDSDPT